jgi:hypothetical protein
MQVRLFLFERALEQRSAILHDALAQPTRS